MLVLLSLIGDEQAAGYDTVRSYATVDAETGANHFREDGEGPHCYVVKRKTDSFYSAAINRLL